MNRCCRVGAEAEGSSPLSLASATPMLPLLRITANLYDYVDNRSFLGAKEMNDVE
jgi:hypothetical protein